MPNNIKLLKQRNLNIPNSETIIKTLLNNNRNMDYQNKRIELLTSIIDQETKRIAVNFAAKVLSDVSEDKEGFIMYQALEKSYDNFIDEFNKMEVRL